jgi:hypothetical protein
MVFSGIKSAKAPDRRPKAEIITNTQGVVERVINELMAKKRRANNETSESPVFSGLMGKGNLRRILFNNSIGDEGLKWQKN